MSTSSSTTPAMMRAVVVSDAGDHRLQISNQVPKPTISNNDNMVLIRTKATAINRADTLQKRGLYPPPKGESPIIGLEMSGVIEEVAKQSTPSPLPWKKGDRVMALLGGGGYAEYVAVHRGLVMPIPENLSLVEAAAIPEVWVTAYQALVVIGGIQQGSKVLIHAGASGVGTAAIQICKKLGCSHIITTSSKSKLEACQKLGATLAIDYTEGPFANRVLSAVPEGVDLIIDVVGANYLEQNLQCGGMDFKLVMLATMGGTKVENLDLRMLFKKRGQIIASTLRNRSLDYKIDLVRRFSEQCLASFGPGGDFHPVIDCVMPIEEVERAHQRVESNLTVGKVVLKFED